MTSLKNYLTATKTTPHSIDRYIIKLREIENNGNYLNPDHLKFDWNYNMAMQANYSYSQEESKIKEMDYIHFKMLQFQSHQLMSPEINLPKSPEVQSNRSSKMMGIMQEVVPMPNEDVIMGKMGFEISPNLRGRSNNI